MKKNYANSIKRSGLLIFIILMSITAKLPAQCPPCNTITTKPPLPYMYVNSTTGKDRRDCFMDGINATDGLSKYKLLSNHLQSNETDNIKCSIDDLIKFICGLSPDISFLKFYIAAYDNSCAKCTIKSKSLDKHLTVIIAPVTGTCNDDVLDRGDYYYINENGIITSLPRACKKGFTSYYENEKSNKVLYKTINNDPDDDQDQDYPGKFSDTKYLIYYLPYFIEFVQKEKCVQDKFYNVKLTGIEIDFCSFTKNGVTLSDHKKHNKDRLSIQFNYLVKDANHNDQPYEIPIDGRGYQNNGDPCRGIVLDEKAPSWVAGSGGDNGTLCPANCPH